MLVQMVTVVLNTVLAPLLIAGWGPGPALGVMGAGLASSISVTVGILILLYYFIKQEKYVQFDTAQFTPDLAVWKRMLDIGLPAGGEMLLMFVYFAVIYLVIQDFGAAAQAGFSIGGRILQSIFMPTMAIAFAIAISALSFFLIDGQVPLNIFVQKMVSATDSYPLLAIPFFVLAGAIMNRAGITRKLLALADALVGHMTGALAQMCTVLATLLGGLTASSSADAAMLAKILGPEMTRHGYSPAFAAVITSCSAIITALIPPSIGLIIYAYIADASVGRLFIGGVIPGLLLAGSLMVVTAVISKKRGYLPLR
jgi:TRAP-type C4-dicarboxylate transport system permease large subunit